MKKYITRRRILLLITLLISLTTLCFIGWHIYVSDKTKLTLNIAPKDALITLNDSSIGHGISYIKPGTYTLTMSRAGFNTLAETINVEAGKPAIVSRLLKPNSQDGFDYEKQNLEYFNKIADIIDSDNYTYNTYFNTEWVQKNYPLLQSLPVYMSSLFSIEDSQSEKYPEDKSKKAVVIYADTPTGKHSALKYIYSIGFDPSDYEIIFKAMPDDIVNMGEGIDNNPVDYNSLYEMGLQYGSSAADDGTE